jgi:hypothetical protein
MQWCDVIHTSSHGNNCLTVEECLKNIHMTMLICDMQWCVAMRTSTHVNICFIVEE